MVLEPNPGHSARGVNAVSDVMNASHAECPRCGVETKLRVRSFSDQATAALIAWGELVSEHVAEPLCENCYGELREVLIDRAEELADAAIAASKVGNRKTASPAAPPSKIVAQASAHKAAAAKTKTPLAKGKSGKKAS